MIKSNNHLLARDDPTDQMAFLEKVHLGSCWDLRLEDHQQGANMVVVVVADNVLVVAADFRTEIALDQVVDRSAFEGKVHPSLAAYWGCLVVEVAAVDVDEVQVVVVQVVERTHSVVVHHIEVVGQEEGHIDQVAAVAPRTFSEEDPILLDHLGHMVDLDPMVDLDSPVEKADLLGCS